jgi:hypothetical protein
MSGPPPGRPRAELQGRTLVGGPATRARFAALLGVDPAAGEGATRVVAAGWLGDHAEIEVAGREGESVVIHLERAQPSQQRLLATEHLSGHYRGTRLWPDLERRLRRARLGATTLEELAAAVAADPDVRLNRDRLPRGAGTDQAGFDQRSLLSTWGSSETWSEFFAVAEISRGRLDSLDVFERGTFIQHCDRDCLLVVPKGPVPMVDRVFYPWLDRVRSVGRPPPRARPADERRRGSIRTTDLRERDVVMGSLDKLEQVLSRVLEEGVDDMLFLSCTCVPFVTGEDVESLVKRYRPKLDKPFFFLTTTPQSSVGVFREVLVTQRRAAEAAAGPPDPRAVNLIGYAREPALEELEAMLAEAGVRVNATFIPEMNFAAVSALPHAPLHVLYPNALWQSTYDQLLFESRIRAVTAPAPFGLRGTERWLAQVLAAVGSDADAAAIAGRASAPHRAALEAIRAEAGRHRLGFVVGAAEVHRLVDPAGTWGVPLLPVVEELGFGIDVMIRAHDRASAHAAAKQVHALLAEPDRHSIKAFADRARLAKLLAEGPFEAVYSDHLFDRRLSSAGKAQFSLQEFEKGFAGAVRTGERLLRVCRLPFYRRYARYLPPEPDAVEARP